LGVSVVAPQTVVDAVRLAAGSSAGAAAALTQYTLPATQVAYIVLGSAAEVDTSGRYRLVPETVVTLDGARLTLGTTKRDAFTVVDARAFFLSKKLKETITFVEVVTRTLTYIRVYTDTFSLVDATKFVLGQKLTETLATTELVARASTKKLTDTPTATDRPLKGVSKPFTDTAATADASTRGTSKRLTELLALSDLESYALQKRHTETVATADTQTRAIYRSVSDGFGLNDSTGVGDGLAVSFAAGISNVAFATDILSRAVTTKQADSVGTTESGSLVSQGYCDLTYFADDYVGTSRTF
jgi:hypothetical protein